MNTTTRFIAFSLAAALTGCATADFTPYEGAQQKWPTSSGAFVQTVEAGHGPMPKGGLQVSGLFRGRRTGRIELSVRSTRRVATLQSGNPAKPKVSDQRS